MGLIWTGNSGNRSSLRENAIYAAAIIGAAVVGVALGALVGRLLTLMVTTAMTSYGGS